MGTRADYSCLRDGCRPALPCSAQEKFTPLAIPNFAQLSYEVSHDPQTVRLPADGAEVQGFQALMNGDFYGEARQGASLSWASPTAGRYHIALVMHDSSGGVERLEVAIGDRELGTIVADQPRTGQVMFVSPRPVELHEGEAIRIATAQDSSAVTFGSVCLLHQMPKSPPLKIENLAASHHHGLDGSGYGDADKSIMIAWTTNRPADGVIRLGDRVIEEGRGLVNNHRVMLPRDVIDGRAQLEISSTETLASQTAFQSYVLHADPLEHYQHHGGKLSAPGVTDIELRVEEPTDRARAEWPVSSGVPLPQGVLVDPHTCRLLDSAGEEVPAQFTVLARHTDGVHVKWLLVDFNATTRADQGVQYTLQCGVAARLKSQGSARPMLIDVESFEQGFAPFANISWNGRTLTTADMARCGFEVTDAEGLVYSSAHAPPDEVVIEDAGPLRTTVRVRGRLTDAEGTGYTRYLCRLHFHAGRPTVRVVFSLDNDVAEPEMNQIGTLRLRIPVTPKQVRVGADDQSRSLGQGQRLLQDEDFRFVIESTPEGRTAEIAGPQVSQEQKSPRDGHRATGWLLVPGQLAVHVRDFWQLYPKGFAVEEDAVVIELLPQLPADQYAGASADDLTKLYYWCDQGRYKLRTGVRLTTEFVVDFDPREEGGRYADAAHWQQPLFAACSPAWYCQSGAFGPMVPRQAGRFEVYERNLDRAFQTFLERRESVREYGFMNFGDWFGERKFNWGNIEYDTQWALAANFARTGNLAMLRRAVQAESHNADVDTKHYGRDAGEVWAHATGHTGGYFPRAWKNMTLFNEGVSGTGHTWCRGHFVLYALTGERRYLETGRKIADRLAAGTTDFHYYAERNIGWPIVALMGAHGTTGNPFHLNGAKLMADMAMWTQSPDTGGWGHWIDTNECRHDNRCWGSKTFMTGVLLHGLKLYDLAQPRPDIRTTIRKNCDFIWRTCYVPRDQGFIYSECLSRRDVGRPGTFSIVGDGLAYGCRLDPAHRHRESLRHAAMGYFYRNGVSDFGKAFTNATCFMPLMLHDLDALGLSRFPKAD